MRRPTDRSMGMASSAPIARTSRGAITFITDQRSSLTVTICIWCRGTMTTIPGAIMVTVMGTMVMGTMVTGTMVTGDDTLAITSTA